MVRWAVRLRSPFAVLACCALVEVASAQSTSGQDSQDARFVFHEVDEGILRLDTRLGEMSLCSRQALGWTCRSVPDERKALDAELARVQQENAELRSALAAKAERETAQASGTSTDAAAKPEAKPEPQAKVQAPEPAKPAEPIITRPNSGDLAYVRAVVGLIWQRMVEMMAKLRADFAKEG
jgi:hypothetical protein